MTYGHPKKPGAGTTLAIDLFERAKASNAAIWAIMSEDGAGSERSIDCKFSVSESQDVYKEVLKILKAR